MPTPHINSLEKANQVFVAASKNIMPSPSPSRKKAVITKLVDDLAHMPQSIEKKKSLLIRVGKYLKRPAYRASLIAAMVAGGFFTYRSGKNIGNMLRARGMVQNPLAQFALGASNFLIPSESGLSRSTEIDLIILAHALNILFGITMTAVMARKLGISLRKKKTPVQK
jgi:hypothetical protein